MLLVLWALGWAMILLSALVHLPTFVVTAIGTVLTGPSACTPEPHRS